MLIIPPGDSFSPFENLIYPFQNSVWLGLFVTIVLFIFLAFLYRKFFDTNFRILFIDVMIIIAGGSQKILPKKDHRRFILAIFILSSLVFRSLYQGVLFQFLQADNCHKEIHSIDEMVEKGFKFYMYPAYEQHVKDMKFYSR